MAELFRSHPIFLLQFGLAMYCLLNYLLEFGVQSVANGKYKSLMRMQSLLCSMFCNLLDVVMRMSVSGDVTFTAPMSGTTESQTNSTTTAHVTRKVDILSLPVNKELLQRARSDMVVLAQRREGQGVAYAAIALSCGSPALSALPVIIRAIPLIMRSFLLLTACAAPVPQLVDLLRSGVSGSLQSGKRGAKKGKGKAGKKSKAPSKPSPHSELIRILFPPIHHTNHDSAKNAEDSIPAAEDAALSLGGAEHHPETLDILADIISLPLEFFIMRQWSRADKPVVSKSAPAAPAVKTSTMMTIFLFAVMMVKSMVVMTYLKARLRNILDHLDPPAAKTSENEISLTQEKPSAPFFMAQWAFFKDPIVANIIALARQLLSPEGMKPGGLGAFGLGGEQPVEVAVPDVTEAEELPPTTGEAEEWGDDHPADTKDIAAVREVERESTSTQSADEAIDINSDSSRAIETKARDKGAKKKKAARRAKDARPE